MEAESKESECAHTEEDSYFSSYADLSVHQLMLKDKPRTEAYGSFIERNADLFMGKTVIDVGAGTGILSLFAAKAGAKKVYAIEASNLAGLCREIVVANGYEDVIEVVHSRVEDCTLPITRADILISEWMGFYLLHEAMLSSVLYARDQWLAPEGIMVPSSATLYLCPVNLKQYVKDNLSFWDNAYGFDYGPLKTLVELKHRTQPSIMTLEDSQCIAAPQEVIHLELKFVESEDVGAIRRKFEFESTKNTICHGIASWFTCNFENDMDKRDEKRVVLSTAPEAPATHWQQTVILLPDPLMLSKGETIGCSMMLQQDSTNQRHYNISIEIDEEEEGSEEDMGENGEVNGAGEGGGRGAAGSVSHEVAECIIKAMGSNRTGT